VNRIGKGLLLLLWLLAGCLGPGTPSAEEQATADAGRQQQVNTLNYVKGQVELIVPAQRHLGTARVSPGGHWMTVGGKLLIDLVTGSEREFTIDSTTLRWLEDDFFISGPYLYHALDLTITALESYRGEEHIELFRGAETVYELTGSGVVLVSTDPAYPYWVATGLSTQETEAALGDIPYATVTPYGQWGLLFGGGQAPSPDGRYYVPSRCPIPVEPHVGGGVCIFDAAKEEMVAAADKAVRHLKFVGWAYDSSGIYFQSMAATDVENAYFPEMPIYKLLVPGAELRGTPAPVATQVP
jgi:hypothetical protein